MMINNIYKYQIQKKYQIKINKAYILQKNH